LSRDSETLEKGRSVAVQIPLPGMQIRADDDDPLSVRQGESAAGREALGNGSPSKNLA